MNDGTAACLGHPWTIGWFAFRADPWRIVGPFPDIDHADRATEILGPLARIAYGMLVGDDDFLPALEP